MMRAIATNSPVSNRNFALQTFHFSFLLPFRQEQCVGLVLIKSPPLLRKEGKSLCEVYAWQRDFCNDRAMKAK